MCQFKKKFIWYIIFKYLYGHLYISVYKYYNTKYLYFILTWNDKFFIIKYNPNIFNKMTNEVKLNKYNKYNKYLLSF